MKDAGRTSTERSAAIALALLLGLVFGCSEDEPAPSGPGGTDEPGITTTLSVRPDTVAAGSVPEVRMIVANLGDESYELQFDGGGAFGVEIADSTGLIAWFPCESDSIPSSMTFGPGTVRVVLFPRDWPRLCWPSPGDSLAPGAYLVEGGLRGYRDTHPWGSAVLTVVEP